LPSLQLPMIMMNKFRIFLD